MQPDDYQNENPTQSLRPDRGVGCQNALQWQVVLNALHKIIRSAKSKRRPVLNALDNRLRRNAFGNTAAKQIRSQATVSRSALLRNTREFASGPHPLAHKVRWKLNSNAAIPPAIATSILPAKRIQIAEVAFRRLQTACSEFQQLSLGNFRRSCQKLGIILTNWLPTPHSPIVSAIGSTTCRSVSSRSNTSCNSS